MANQELMETLDNGKLQIRVQATDEDIEFIESLIAEFELNGEINNSEFSKRLSNYGTKKYQREFIKTEIHMED